MRTSAPIRKKKYYTVKYWIRKYSFGGVHPYPLLRKYRTRAQAICDVRELCADVTVGRVEVFDREGNRKVWELPPLTGEEAKAFDAERAFGDGKNNASSVAMTLRRKYQRLYEDVGFKLRLRKRRLRRKEKVPNE